MTREVQGAFFWYSCTVYFPCSVLLPGTVSQGRSCRPSDFGNKDIVIDIALLGHDFGRGDDGNG